MKWVTLDLTVQPGVYTQRTDRDVSQLVNVLRKTAIMCAAVKTQQETYVLGMLFALHAKTILEYNDIYLCENKYMANCFSN